MTSTVNALDPLRIMIDAKEVSEFIIQNSFTMTSKFSVSLSYDQSKQLSRGLIHGLSQQEISILVNRITAHRDDIGLPMLLPSLLLIFRVESATSKVRDCHDEIIKIEYKTGIRTKWHPKLACCNGDDTTHTHDHYYNAVDFDEVTADLTSLTAKLAYVEFVCEVHLPMLEEFDRINRRILQVIPKESRDHLEQVERRLRRQNTLLRSSLRSTLYRAGYLYKRSQGQVQTVRVSS